MKSKKQRRAPPRSPFKWVGGKLRLRKTIVAMLPPHQCYVEVFGGAAWVLFAKPISKVEILYDLRSIRRFIIKVTW